MHVDEEEEGEEKEREREAAGARREARKEQRIRSIDSAYCTRYR